MPHRVFQWVAFHDLPLKGATGALLVKGGGGELYHSSLPSLARLLPLSVFQQVSFHGCPLEALLMDWVLASPSHSIRTSPANPKLVPKDMSGPASIPNSQLL